MIASQAPVTIRQTLATADRLGATIPKHIRTEHNKLTELWDGVRRLDNLTADPPAAVLAALSAGADPTTDAAVQQALTTQALIAAAPSVRSRFHERCANFIREHGADLIAAFAKPFDAAAEDIAAGQARLGDVSLEDAESTVSLGGDAAEALLRARRADQRTAEIVDTWKHLGTFTSALSINRQWAVLAIADVPPEQFVDDGLRGVQLGAWDAARRGYTLSMATPGVLAERVAAVQDQQERGAAQRAGDFTDAFKRSHGIGKAVTT